MSSNQVFKFEVLRNEWVAQIGHIDEYGGPATFKPYWTSEPFNNRDDAVKALEAHEEVGEYSKQLMRYKMRHSYTKGNVTFRKVKVDEFDR